MNGWPDDETEVLAGVAGDDLRWVVVAGGSDGDFSTMLHVFRGEKMLAGSGFGGPKLNTDSLINEWRGRKDDLPYFVMARVSPIIDRVVATTDRGSEVQLSLSPVIERFGLRFAAAPLPDGEAPAGIRVERAGRVLEGRRQPMPPSPAEPKASQLICPIQSSGGMSGTGKRHVPVTVWM